MSDANENPVYTYSAEYLGKVFYFCLKKTGNEYEAEELASDISVCVLDQLRRGAAPAHFSAWVWKIARNRYSLWAANKRKSAERSGYPDVFSPYIPDVGDMADADDATEAGATPYGDLSDEVVHRENLALLRRELAFTCADYRNLLVEYYIEDKSIRDIAKKFGLTDANVKTRLFRARNILKEGMTMAREFGAKSYKPEEVSFAASGDQPSGLPWKAVQRNIPKNILLEASDNPSTIEELSIALGVAVPYMEEEVRLLCDATLLRKIGDKYVTDFFIEDRNCQLDIYNFLRSGAKERSALADTIANDISGALRGLGVVPENMSDGELKWWSLLWIIDRCIFDITPENIFYPKTRANGETWGFIGYESVEFPEKLTMSLNGGGDGVNTVSHYDIPAYGLPHDGRWIDCKTVKLFHDIIEKGLNIGELSEFETLTWNNINGRIAHADANGNMIPDILVFRKGDIAKAEEIVMSHPLYKKLLANVKDAYAGIVEILRRNSSEILRDGLDYYASMDICYIRMMAVNDEVENGGLTVPDNSKKCSVGMWFEIG